MFLGLYEHSLDEKGRLVLPRKFRAAFAEGCVLSKGHEGAVEVWPTAAYEEHLHRYSPLPGTREKVRSFKRSRTVFASAEIPDRQGRVTVSEVLRRWAGMDSQVVVTGVDDHLELWAPQVWAEIEVAVDEVFRNMDEDLDTIGESS
ncbi:MAG: division/cell wall cluster transcriptional repressor MraZ [Acidimicrobiia bacterium]